MNIKQILFICVTSVGSLACTEKYSFINQLEGSFLQQSCVLTNPRSNDGGSVYDALKYHPNRREEVQKVCAELEWGLIFAAYGNKDQVEPQLTDDELREKLTTVVGPQELPM